MAVKNDFDCGNEKMAVAEEVGNEDGSFGEEVLWMRRSMGTPYQA
jgi:hypothetical protein